MIVEIYTKDDCVFCMQAKQLLDLKRIEFTESKLGVDITRTALKKKFPDAQTFPVIVVDGTYIGGYNELREHLFPGPSSTAQLLTE